MLARPSRPQLQEYEQKCGIDSFPLFKFCFCQSPDDRIMNTNIEERLLQAVAAATSIQLASL